MSSYGLHCGPPKILESSPPEPVYVTFFGNKNFADDKIKMRPLGWALIQYDCVLMEGGHLDTEKDMRREKVMYRLREQTVTYQ